MPTEAPLHAPVLHEAVPLSLKDFRLISAGISSLWKRIVAEHPEADAHSLLLSYDVHPTPDGAALIEVNTNAGGVLAAFRAARALNDCCANWGQYELQSRLLELFRHDLLGKVAESTTSRSSTTTSPSSRCSARCSGSRRCCAPRPTPSSSSMRASFAIAMAGFVTARSRSTASIGAARISSSKTRSMRPCCAPSPKAARSSRRRPRPTEPFQAGLGPRRLCRQDHQPQEARRAAERGLSRARARLARRRDEEPPVIERVSFD
jgi:hypothetical protein